MYEGLPSFRHKRKPPRLSTSAFSFQTYMLQVYRSMNKHICILSKPTGLNSSILSSQKQRWGKCSNNKIKGGYNVRHSKSKLHPSYYNINKQTQTAKLRQNKNLLYSKVHFIEMRMLILFSPKRILIGTKLTRKEGIRNCWKNIWQMPTTCQGLFPGPFQS